MFPFIWGEGEEQGSGIELSFDKQFGGNAWARKFPFFLRVEGIGIDIQLKRSFLADARLWLADNLGTDGWEIINTSYNFNICFSDKTQLMQFKLVFQGFDKR